MYTVKTPLDLQGAFEVGDLVILSKVYWANFPNEPHEIDSDTLLELTQWQEPYWMAHCHYSSDPSWNLASTILLLPIEMQKLLTCSNQAI